MTIAHSTPGFSSLRDAPQMRSGLFGWSIGPFRKDPLGFMARACRAHGDLVRFGAGPLSVYISRSPETAQRVLVDNRRNYDKKTRGYDALRLFLGNGLLTSEGEFWKRQRRIAQPAFHRQRIAAFGETMVAMTEQALRRWEPLARAQQPVDIAEEMTALTLRIAAKTLLSTDVTDEDNSIGTAVSELNLFAREIMTNPLAIPWYVPTPRNRRYRKWADMLDGVVDGIIEERRRTGRDEGDLLSMLMNATDAETGERMSDVQLRDEVMTIFLAGHETTANNLAWTFYLLSTHPDVQRRLRSELVDVLGGRAPTVDDLPRLPWLRAVMHESLRLYPPAWSIGRRCIDDDVLDGYRIRGGSIILLSPWLTHRDPRYWDNPEGFDPSRFDEGWERARPRYAYFPFGGGPRLCIGNNFALMEAQLVLATVLQRFSPALAPGWPVVPQPLITLKPKYGISMILRPAVDD